MTLAIGGAQDAGKAKSGAAGSVAQTLIDLENQWAKASKESNSDALAPLLSSAFVGVDSDGSIRDKATLLARVKKAKWTTSEISDMKVTMHGDSAIVSGTWAGKGIDSDGKSVNTRERWLDTWVKTGGKWVCVASASAPLK